MTVTIRDARADDALCLGVLGTQVFLDTYATHGIRPALAREVLSAFSTAAMATLIGQTLVAPALVRVRLAEFDGHLIGFAVLKLGQGHDSLVSAAPAELDKLYVQEAFTGLGVGSALLHDAEMLARASGASDLWLTPWSGNLRALQFYRGQGYQDHGLTWFRFEGEAHANRVFSRPLAG